MNSAKTIGQKVGAQGWLSPVVQKVGEGLRVSGPIGVYAYAGSHILW